MKDTLAENFIKNLRAFIDLNIQSYGDKKKPVMAIAELIGRSESHVHNIFSGRKIPNETERRKICEYFGLDYDSMVGIKGVSKNNVVALSRAPNHKHHRIINQFDDQSTACEINEALVNIEKASPDVYRDVVGYIRGAAATIRSLSQRKPKVKNGGD